jgi:hypothetical protein
MSHRTTGVFILHQKRAERIVASAISGIRENGDAFVTLSGYPEAGVFVIPSRDVLEVRDDVAFDLVGLIHVILAALVWLGRTDPVVPAQPVATPVVQAVGTPRQRVFCCRFDEAESFKLVTEPDGHCTLEFSAHLAEQLARALASELGRIAAWVPDDGRRGPTT